MGDLGASSLELSPESESLSESESPDDSSELLLETFLVSLVFLGEPSVLPDLSLLSQSDSESDELPPSWPPELSCFLRFLAKVKSS